MEPKRKIFHFACNRIQNLRMKALALLNVCVLYWLNQSKATAIRWVGILIIIFNLFFFFVKLL